MQSDHRSLIELTHSSSKHRQHDGHIIHRSSSTETVKWPRNDSRIASLDPVSHQCASLQSLSPESCWPTMALRSLPFHVLVPTRMPKLPGKPPYATTVTYITLNRVTSAKPLMAVASTCPDALSPISKS